MEVLKEGGVVPKPSKLLFRFSSVYIIPSHLAPSPPMAWPTEPLIKLPLKLLSKRSGPNTILSCLAEPQVVQDHLRNQLSFVICRHFLDMLVGSWYIGCCEHIALSIVDLAQWAKSILIHRTVQFGIICRKSRFLTAEINNYRLPWWDTSFFTRWLLTGSFLGFISTEKEWFYAFQYVGFFLHIKFKDIFSTYLIIEKWGWQVK